MSRKVGEVAALQAKGEAVAEQDRELSVADLTFFPNYLARRSMAERSTRQKKVIARDAGFCQVPGCSRAAAHAHHVLYRSRGGADEESNMVSLCAAHHLHGVHRGRVRVRGRAPEGLTWELGVRPGGAPLVVVGVHWRTASGRPRSRSPGRWFCLTGPRAAAEQPAHPQGEPARPGLGRDPPEEADAGVARRARPLGISSADSTVTCRAAAAHRRSPEDSPVYYGNRRRPRGASGPS